MIKIEKSIYDKPEKSDGERILVMRLWPRGMSKDRAKIDAWLKELGTEREMIRKWKDGEITWKDYVAAYRKSLRGKENLLEELAEKSEKGDVTLLCVEKDPSKCHRSILAEEIRKIAKRK